LSKNPKKNPPTISLVIQKILEDFISLKLSFLVIIYHELHFSSGFGFAQPPSSAIIEAFVISIGFLKLFRRKAKSQQQITPIIEIIENNWIISCPQG